MYKLYAVELNEDGTEELLSPIDTNNMKLPFHDGWDHWAVFQNDEEIWEGSDFMDAFHVWASLTVQHYAQDVIV